MPSARPLPSGPGPRSLPDLPERKKASPCPSRSRQGTNQAFTLTSGQGRWYFHRVAKEMTWGEPLNHCPAQLEEPARRPKDGLSVKPYARQATTGCCHSPFIACSMKYPAPPGRTPGLCSADKIPTHPISSCPCQCKNRDTGVPERDTEKD